MLKHQILQTALELLIESLRIQIYRSYLPKFSPLQVAHPADINDSQWLKLGPAGGCTNVCGLHMDHVITSSK